MVRYSMHTDGAEMRRRWDAALSEMEKDGIDCLLLATNGNWMNGTFKYLTDIPYINYPMYALFGREGLTIFAHGSPSMGALPMVLGNVAEVVAMPYLISMCYMDDEAGKAIAERIRGFGHKTVGLVGLGSIPASVYRVLTAELPDRDFPTASDLVDRLKAVKSLWEVQKYQEGMRLMDRITDAVPLVLREGRSVFDVSCDLRHLAAELGCWDQYISVRRQGVSDDVPFRRGDSCISVVELTFPGGFWAECGRVYSFGPPSEELVRIHRYSMEIQDRVASLLRPGAEPRDVFAEMNRMLTAGGFPPEDRIGAHSQSCDMVDRPCIVEKETMRIRENMVFAVHPTCIGPFCSAGNTDNYLVTADGGVRMTKTSRELVVLE